MTAKKDLKGAIFDIKDIYTPLSVAKKEIWRRWNDKELRKKVEDFLGGDLPAVFKSKPKAALFRFIATPNLEFQLAFETAKLLNLKMIFMEFLNDRFCTRNLDKVHLGKLIFYREKKGKSQDIVSRKKIINLEQCENKPLKEIKTVSGKSLIDFHHKLFFGEYKNIKTFDVSNFKTNGESNFDVYLKILPLFICHGILFENYFVNYNKDENRFTYNVVIPAFIKISKVFGVKPLIVPLISYKEEGDLFWQYYPNNLSKKIKI